MRSRFAQCTLLRAQENPDTLALARRVSDCISGPPQPLWQYVAVSVQPSRPVIMHDGWQLAPVDGASDTLLPLDYPARYVRPYSAEEFHVDYSPGQRRERRTGRRLPRRESGAHQ